MSIEATVESLREENEALRRALSLPQENAAVDIRGPLRADIFTLLRARQIVSVETIERYHYGPKPIADWPEDPQGSIRAAICSLRKRLRGRFQITIAGDRAYRMTPVRIRRVKIPTR